MYHFLFWAPFLVTWRFGSSSNLQRLQRPQTTVLTINRCCTEMARDRSNYRSSSSRSRSSSSSSSSRWRRISNRNCPRTTRCRQASFVLAVHFGRAGSCLKTGSEQEFTAIFYSISLLRCLLLIFTISVEFTKKYLALTKWNMERPPDV